MKMINFLKFWFWFCFTTAVIWAFTGATPWNEPLDLGRGIALLIFYLAGFFSWPVYKNNQSILEISKCKGSSLNEPLSKDVYRPKQPSSYNNRGPG